MKEASVNNLQQLRAERGFTIVELLIVIVVIGILAAIVIVAYNGVQNRAKTSKAQSAASAVIKKLEAYRADETGSYPATFGTLTNSSNSTKTYYVTGITFTTTTTLPTNAPANGAEATVTYSTCGAGGARASYWDYSLATPAIAHLYTGNATSTSACTVVNS